MEFLKQNKIQIFIIFVIALATWYKILDTVPTGEGYYYFSKSNNIDFKNISLSSILGSYDYFAKLIFTFLIPIFKDNIAYYMYFQFLIMITSYLTFYFVCLKIFRDKILSTLSTIFFIANYVGQFTMMGQGGYQRFIQRVPNVIPTLISFLFLVYFLRTQKMKYFLFSFSIYLLSIIASHYTSFFLPLFVFLPIIYSLVTKKIALKKTVLIALLFSITTFVIIHTDTLSRPNTSILNFTLHTPRLSEMIAYQISETGFPIEFIQFLGTHAKPPVPLPYIQTLAHIFIIISIFLYLGFLKIKKDKELLAIYLTLILSLFAVSFLMMYAYDTTPNPLINFGENRIYFIHSIFFAVIWGIIIKAYFGNKKKITYITVAILISALFLIQNVPTIWKEMDRIEVHSKIASDFLKTMKNLSPKFNKDTVIIAPWEMLTTQTVYEHFYNIPNSNFITLDNLTKTDLTKITNHNDNVFVFTHE